MPSSHVHVPDRSWEISRYIQAVAALSIRAQTPNATWEPAALPLKTLRAEAAQPLLVGFEGDDLPEAEGTTDRETQQTLDSRRCRAQTTGPLSARPAPPPCRGLRPQSSPVKGGRWQHPHIPGLNRRGGNMGHSTVQAAGSARRPLSGLGAARLPPAPPTSVRLGGRSLPSSRFLFLIVWACSRHSSRARLSLEERHQRIRRSW